MQNKFTYFYFRGAAYYRFLSKDGSPYLAPLKNALTTAK